MKRMLLFMAFLCITGMLNAQLEEDFDPNPTGWILSQGAGFGQVSGNKLVLTPGVGGNNPAVVGTPAVSKTSNTVKVCLDIWAYTSNLNNQVAFPCDTYMDVLFVKSTVTSANDAEVPENIYARVDGHLLPTNGGNSCFTFTFPDGVASDFKVFLSFRAGCNQPGIKYVIDNISISGVDEACAGNACPPTALDDVFNRGNFSELSFNAVLYGSNNNYPAPPAGYAADATGTDNDQNDTYGNLQWTVLTQPANGSVTVNADGTCTITRNSILVSQLVFTYRLCDDGADDNFATTADNLCDDATVTVNFPVAAPTPVTLLNFDGNRNGDQVTLKWTTTVESNNKGFHVQRSIGANNYETIGFVATKAVDGNSSSNLAYTFKDVNSASTITWYRLVQEDKDGTIKIHTATAVRGQSAESRVQVFPNPSVNGNLTVLFSNTAAREVLISNLGGKTVKRWNNYTSDRLAVSGLDAGMYMLLVTDKETGKRSVEKIIVTRQ